MQSEFKNMFINWQEFWGGEPTQEQVDKIYKRKSGAPTRMVQHPDGSETEVRLQSSFCVLEIQCRHAVTARAANPLAQ